MAAAAPYLAFFRGIFQTEAGSSGFAGAGGFSFFGFVRGAGVGGGGASDPLPW